MKILFNTYPTAFFKKGGGEKQLIDYKDMLESNNHQVDFFDMWNCNLTNEHDIVHIFGAFVDNVEFMSYVFDNFNNIPIVVSPNFWIDIEAWEKEGKLDKIKKLLWMADIVIVNSYIEEEFLVRHLKRDSSRIGVVHNTFSEIFLDTVEEDIFREKYNIHGKYILNVANVEERKNQLAFLRALYELNMFPEYTLITIGNIRSRYYYEACKEVAGDNFINIPFVENNDPILRSAYTGCEFFAMPSLVETPSISAIEAAVLGKKILITEVGSTKEYFLDFVEYVNPYDISSIKFAVQRLLKNDYSEKINKMQIFIKSNFSKEQVSRELIYVYEQVSTGKKTANKIKIHQFHSGSAYGDSITNGMLFIQKMLIQMGCHSEIYVEHVAPELKEKLKHFSEYPSSEDNILLLHHSMGHDQDEWIKNLKDKIVLVYHNITPESFFPKENPFHHYSIKGRQQLDILKHKSIGGIGDSQLNVDELISRGFGLNQTKVIPMLFDIKEIKSHSWNHELFDKESRTFNLLFVGRVSENKCQHDIIEVFNKFHQMSDKKTKCFIVGGLSGDDYEYRLRNIIREYDLEESVILTGKVTDEDLYAYYRLADVFICLSEHEGFGIPLVESMVFDLPIIAIDNSNIKNTLNGGGILLEEKNIDDIANILIDLSNNRSYRREVLYGQRNALKNYQPQNIKKALVEFLNLLNINISYSTEENTDHSADESILFQIEGSFDSTYSLASVNREMARSLNKLYPNKVSLFSTEGGGDFKYDEQFVGAMVDVSAIAEKGVKALSADIVLRNLYPPRVHDARGLINLMNAYGWEESSFPSKYVEDFNEYLDALPVMSKYVQKIMVDNGVLVPTVVTGIGVDHVLSNTSKDYPLKTNKKFKFLHISSCFPRKGVDVLLEAYCSTFSQEDDVCLIIKTFPNIHNTIVEQIHKKQQENSSCPEIELINEDLEESYIIGLYQCCSCLVAPSRGEGYGLPIAEAMLFDMPVIATGYSGQMDFCSEETAWLIDFNFESANTHMGLFNSYWANPKVDHLSSLMKELFKLPQSDIQIKTEKAKRNILDNHKWSDCAQRLVDYLNVIKENSINNEPARRIGWVSTWNSKCGIATYSRFLIDNLMHKDGVTIFANKLPKDDVLDSSLEVNVNRVWSDARDESLYDLYEAIIKSEIDTLVIQFNFGFFNLLSFQQMLEQLRERNIKTYIQFHSVADVNKEDFKASLGWIKETLKYVNRLLVHNIEDTNILKSFGLIENVTLLPHGVINCQPSQKIIKSHQVELGLNGKFVIASYGFMLPQKGIKELIEAFSFIKIVNENTHLLLVNAIYPIDISEKYATECKELIKRYGLESSITMINEFLSDEESLNYLSCADMLVMAYKSTKESSSAAVRYALSTKKPVLCTPQYIFSDVKDVVHFTSNETVESLCESLRLLMDSPDLLKSKNDNQTAWLEAHSWSRISKRLLSIINSEF